MYLIFGRKKQSVNLFFQEPKCPGVGVGVGGGVPLVCLPSTKINP